MLTHAARAAAHAKQLNKAAFSKSFFRLGTFGGRARRARAKGFG